MKKTTFMFLSLLVSLITMADDSGSCGNNVTYNYVESTHTLTISGSGNMGDLYSSNPWAAYKSDIVKVIIEDGVTSIGKGAFRGCVSLMSVSISNTVKSIGLDAFYNCVSIPSITIPSSVTSINSGAFSGCSALTSVHISDIAAWCSIYFPDGGSASNENASPLRDGRKLFLDDVEIKDLVIPDGVTSINNFVFRGCNSLSSVTIPNSVITIGKESFANCPMTSVAIGNGVTSFGASAFRNCANLTSVTIEDGVTSLGESIFYKCSSLSSISIPNSVTSIGGGAFSGCNSLKNVTLPNDITMIRISTFLNCISLKSIVIPAKVEYIYQSAFANCGLEEVKVLANTPPIAYDNTFSNYNIPLYAPETSISAYQSTTPWSNFTSFKTLSGEDMEIKQCDKPIITISNGKLYFSCTTENVEYHWSLSSGGDSNGTGNSVTLAKKTVVKVYASKEGYKDSPTTTMEITDTGIRGDVNQDSTVDVADISAIITIMARKNN